MKSGAGLPAGALALRAELQGRKMRKVGSVAFGDHCAVLRLGADSLWAIIEGPEGAEMALRCAWALGSALEIHASDESGLFELASSLGIYRVRVTAPDEGECLLRVVTTLTPSADVTIPWWPRDLYPLGPGGDPATVAGKVFAAQRGLNTGLVYGRIDGATGGSFYYQQDLTSLDEFFRLTETQPDGVVGGEWPELGYEAPAVQDRPLPAGREVVVSDALLRLDAATIEDGRDEARLFLEHQAAIYPHLNRPTPNFHDWPAMAEATLRDLARSPLATTEDGGYRYVRPYVKAEYPDSMVQITVLAMVREFGQWKGETPDLAGDLTMDLAGELRAGVYRFFDPDLGTIRRYLNTVGSDKNPNEVDSWYLYHPLQGLGRLAKRGDEEAGRLLLDSIEYAIEVARMFDYEWPIQFDIDTLQITTASREPGKAIGQTDAGGLYAYVMLEAHELTGEERYLEEAKRAIRKTETLRFTLVYQTNLTSWGATACLRLWELTGDRFFLDQASVFLAGFFHNCAMWDAKIGTVPEPTTFLGVTCLHNGPYMAPFECYESVCAFHEALALAEDDLPDGARLLMAEFGRYALERGWWFYPSSLPETGIAHNPRNGVIARNLAFPLEDLYVNGDPPGQVGQEIYGLGAALAYTTHSFHPLDAEHRLFCEYPLRNLAIHGHRATFAVRGAPGSVCHAQILPPEGVTVTVDGRKADPARFEVSVGAEVKVSWRSVGRHAPTDA